MRIRGLEFDRQDFPMPSPLSALRRFVLFGCLLATSLLAAGCDSNGTTGPEGSQGKTHVANRPVQPAITDEELVASLDNVLDFTQRRHLSATDHNAWQIVHGILAF